MQQQCTISQLNFERRTLPKIATVAKQASPMLPPPGNYLEHSKRQCKKHPSSVDFDKELLIYRKSMGAAVKGQCLLSCRFKVPATLHWMLQNGADKNRRKKIFACMIKEKNHLDLQLIRRCLAISISDQRIALKKNQTLID